MCGMALDLEISFDGAPAVGSGRLNGSEHFEEEAEEVSFLGVGRGACGGVWLRVIFYTHTPTARTLWN